MPTKTGFGKGFINRAYPGAGSSVPLLSSFYFRFEKAGTSTPVDNNINSIMVLPGGVSQDLSPNADLNPTTVQNGRIDLMYRDDDPSGAKDRYFFKVSHALKPVAIARRFQFRDVGCLGKCEQVLPPSPFIGGIFVLVGFKLFFIPSDVDRHIDAVAVYEDNGKLKVEFNDRNDDDVFGYLVDYAWVSGIGQNIQIGEESGSANGGAHVDLPQGEKVIRGFRFDFASKDRHLRDIGVLTSNNNLEVYFEDDTASYAFQWNVRWAIITPQVVNQ